MPSTTQVQGAGRQIQTPPWVLEQREGGGETSSAYGESEAKAGGTDLQQWENITHFQITIF